MNNQQYVCGRNENPETCFLCEQEGKDYCMICADRFTLEEYKTIQKVCDEWLSNFEVFQEWALANGYKDNLTIERKDNLLGYCPNNCTWITIQEQAINRRPRRKAIK